MAAETTGFQRRKRETKGEEAQEKRREEKGREICSVDDGRSE